MFLFRTYLIIVYSIIMILHLVFLEMLFLDKNKPKIAKRREITIVIGLILFVYLPFFIYFIIN